MVESHACILVSLWLITIYEDLGGHEKSDGEQDSVRLDRIWYSGYCYGLRCTRLSGVMLMGTFVGEIISIWSFGKSRMPARICYPTLLSHLPRLIHA